MLPLLLPAPRFHECIFCGITSNYVASHDVRSTRLHTLYFVEQAVDECDPPWQRWDLCDLCHNELQAKLCDRTPHISVHRGCTNHGGWESITGFGLFDRTPMICVSNASDNDWQDGPDMYIQREFETWLFCRTRAEWRSAWQIARILAKSGNQCRPYEHLLKFLPAWKPAGSDQLYITVAKLPTVTASAEPLLFGDCDGCGAQDVILYVEKGTQWANCPACRKAAQEHREEREGK